MKRDDRVRLRHMADAIRSTLRFTAGRRREELEQDEMLIFALVHALQIVGEAASKISNSTRNEHPQIPWARVIGMRHRLSTPTLTSTSICFGLLPRETRLNFCCKSRHCWIRIDHGDHLWIAAEDVQVEEKIENSLLFKGG